MKHFLLIAMAAFFVPRAGGGEPGKEPSAYRNIPLWENQAPGAAGDVAAIHDIRVAGDETAQACSARPNPANRFPTRDIRPAARAREAALGTAGRDSRGAVPDNR